MHDGGQVGGHVVTVEADVEAAQGQPHALDLLDSARDALGQHVAAGDDAHEHEVVQVLVGLEYLVCHARDRAVYLRSVHAHGLYVH